MTLTRRLLTIVPCVTLLGLAACNGDDDADPTSTSEPATTTATTAPPSTSAPTSTSTTTTTTSSTTTSTTGAPTTVQATIDPTTPIENEDWAAVIQQLLNVRNELYATADPSRAGEVCAQGVFCYDQLVAQLTDMQSKGWHVEGQSPLSIVSATLENSSSGSGVEVVSVRAEIRLPEESPRMVDAAGNTVYEMVPEDPDAPREGVERWLLVRGVNGWRFLEQETIS